MGDSLGIPVVIADPDMDDTSIVDVTPSFEELALYTTHKVIGRSCRFLQGKATDRHG